MTRVAHLRALLAVAGLLLITATPSRSQSWTSADWVPIFKPGAAQVAASKKARESALCLSNLRALWNAAHVYALDHNDRFPTDWSSLQRALTRPDVLYCPTDSAHPTQSDWSKVDFAAISYEREATGEDLYRCVVHQNAVSIRGDAKEARPYDSRIPWSGIPTPALIAAKEAASSVGCIRNLQELRFAAMAFANDNENRLPNSWEDLLGSDLRLSTFRCPADSLNGPPADPSSGNYSLDAVGANANESDLAFARCLIHGHTIKVEGAVVLGTDRYPPRLIVGHPLSRTVAPAHTTTLEVLTGRSVIAPLQFQWRKLQPIDTSGEPFTNTVVIPGATNSTLVITNAGASAEGFYDVIVKEGSGAAQLSWIAFVRVAPSGEASVDPALICLNNLRQINLAGNLYASLHGDFLPNSLESLQTFLGWPCTLFCPSDSGRVAPTNWSLVSFDDTSYLFNGGLMADGGPSILATCKTHGFSTHIDGVISSNPPRFMMPTLQTGGAALITHICGRDQIATLESSPDFKTWTSVATNATGETVLQRTNPPTATRFFRARVEPGTN